MTLAKPRPKLAGALGPTGDERKDAVVDAVLSNPVQLSMGVAAPAALLARASKYLDRVDQGTLGRIAGAPEPGDPTGVRKLPKIMQSPPLGEEHVQTVGDFLRAAGSGQSAAGESLPDFVRLHASPVDFASSSSIPKLRQHLLTSGLIDPAPTLTMRLSRTRELRNMSPAFLTAHPTFSLGEPFAVRPGGVAPPTSSRARFDALGHATAPGTVSDKPLKDLSISGLASMLGDRTARQQHLVMTARPIRAGVLGAAGGLGMGQLDHPAMQALAPVVAALPGLMLMRRRMAGTRYAKELLEDMVSRGHLPVGVAGRHSAWQGVPRFVAEGTGTVITPALIAGLAARNIQEKQDRSTLGDIGARAVEGVQGAAGGLIDLVD